MRYGKNLNQKLRKQLLSDTAWWIAIIGKWASGVESDLEYPILSASVLLNNPRAIYVVQSDISGEDGLGYLHGFLNDDNPEFLSRSWSKFQEEVSSDIEKFSVTSMLYSTSHDSELKGLAHFLSCTKINNAMLLWVTDSLSGAWSINKGRCKEEAGLLTLAYIYSRADDLKLQLVALWVPRDLNQTADYLSHLSAYLDRSEVGGRLKDLTTPDFCPVPGNKSNTVSLAKTSAGRVTDGEQEKFASHIGQGCPLQEMVWHRGDRVLPCDISQRSGFRGRSCPSKPRFYKISGSLHRVNKIVQVDNRSMAQCARGEDAQKSCQGTPVRRHVTWSTKESPPPFPPASDVWNKRKAQGSETPGSTSSFHRS